LRKKEGGIPGFYGIWRIEVVGFYKRRWFDCNHG